MAAILIAGTCAAGAGARPAQAFDPIKPVCAVGGLISGILGKACTVVRHLMPAKHAAGGAVRSALGASAGAIASKATFALGLAAMVTWVLGGAKYALNETANVIGRTTTPQLRTTWFSSNYWRIAGIAALLTLPFLFAAAIQALLQSDLSLLLRAALGYLPLAFLAVSIAAPLTMLLLAASDELSAIVSSASGHASAHFLGLASGAVGTFTLLSRSPFLVFFAGLLTVAGAVVLWFELLLRAAAIYVIVLMLPLAFAALVWPARRVWAVRAVELLIALILSKFAIVAVLSLGGAAMSQSALHSVTGMFAGVVLLGMGAFAPWALLRLLPLSEIASGAVGSFRGESGPARRWAAAALGAGGAAHDWATTTAEMSSDADGFAEPTDGDDARAQVERLGGGETLAAGSAGAHGHGSEGQTAEPQPGAPATNGATGGGNGASDEANGAGDVANGASEVANGAGDVASPAPRERSPGLGPIWQMEDFSWPATTLGLEDGWPPPPIDPEAARSSPGSAEGDPFRGGGARSESPGGGGGPDRSGGAHEDHDPTPAPQPPEDGRL